MNPTLQAVHDEAVERRQRLVLEREAEQQAQKLKDFILECEHNRINKQNTFETLKQEHKLKLDNEKYQICLKNQTTYKQLSIEQLRLYHEARLEYIRNLNDLGVDLTQYLIATDQAAASSDDDKKNSIEVKCAGCAKEEEA